MSNGKLLNKPIEIAEQINKYFIDKITSLKNNIPVRTKDPLDLLRKSLQNWNGLQNRQNFELREVSLIEVCNMLKDMKTSNTMGHDGLDAMSCKLIAPSIIRPLQHILNTSIRTQTFCNKWKIGKFIPLLKNGAEDKLSIKYYRPISILPTVSKLMEKKTIQTQVIHFMEESRQFNKNLHAYRQLVNTTTALLQLTDFSIEAADNSLIPQLMMLDQSAAFDSVDSAILDGKMDLYGFTDNTRRWFRSYLTNRSQFVEIGATWSSMRAVQSGVPQGSILGPILYLLYTNELPDIMKSEDCNQENHNRKDNLFGENCKKCGIMSCFTDDCTIAIARKTSNENINTIRVKLDEISEFLSNNDLCVNQGKTTTQNFMVRQKRSKLPPDPPVLKIQTTNGEKLIHNKVQTRLLGLNLHQDMSWRAHFESGYKALFPAIRRKIGALVHVGASIPRKGRLTLANGLVMSKICYTMAVWGGTHLNHLTTLQRLQNKAARFVINGGRNWKTQKLMENCKWLTIRELVVYHTMVTLWKILRFKKPSQLFEKLVWIEDNKIETTNPRLQTTSMYWRWRSTVTWNELSSELRQILRISKFKSELKKHLLSKRSNFNDDDWLENDENDDRPPPDLQ